MKTYSDQMCEWLIEQGYTHCFFVAGGNIMHFLNSARSRFICIPVIHEVSAGIAAEYFNELDKDDNSKAFALVTAGPGLTNIITSIAGAHMESRALLVIGGQVKSGDLANGQVRQRGIQEIDGVSIVKTLCKEALTLRKTLRKSEFIKLESQAHKDRKGVVFLEICLDVQGQSYDEKLNDTPQQIINVYQNRENAEYLDQLKNLILNAERPVILIGGGVSRKVFSIHYDQFRDLGIPLMGTWNGADRIPNDEEIYWGRPNTWGMRYSNILIQQSDLIIAIGTRLGLQHTGFNWQEFAPLASIVQIDVDKSELTKGHPRISLGIQENSSDFLSKLFAILLDTKLNIEAWLQFGKAVKQALPLSDPLNNSFEGYWNPYDFMGLLSKQFREDDVLVPSSSGAAETVAMQSAIIPRGAYVITDKGMASMGYGLAGAIGAAFKTGKRIFHIEGDGGFAQNLQELGTVSINKLPLKTFIFDNGGYASIKMTQKSYYDGNIIGCDFESGLGLPNWQKLFDAFGISCNILNPQKEFSKEVISMLEDNQPRAFLIPIHPDQTYYPKITSRVINDGSMISNPLHLMTPDLSFDQINSFLPHLKDRINKF